MTNIQISLGDDILRRLDRRVARDGSSRSAIIRAALEEHLRGLARRNLEQRCREAYARRPGSTDALPEPDWDFGDLW